MELNSTLITLINNPCYQLQAAVTVCPWHLIKMLDGKVQGELKCFTPVLSEPLRLCKKRTRNSLEGIQVVSRVRVYHLRVHETKVHELKVHERKRIQGIQAKLTIGQVIKLWTPKKTLHIKLW